MARPTHVSVAVGLPLVILGEAGRFWAAGYLKKLSTLTTAGPYALCRNPIYVSTFLACAGFLLICNRPLVCIAGAVLFWVLHGGAVIYEETLLSRKFGEQYAQYRACVPRFLPRLRGPSGEGRFSLRQLVSNNEHLGLAAAAALLLIFGLNAWSSGRSPIGWLVSLKP